MKRKFFNYLSVFLFAAAMLVNVNLNKSDTQSTLLKENLEAIALADGEVIIGDICATYIKAWCLYDDGFWADGYWL